MGNGRESGNDTHGWQVELNPGLLQQGHMASVHGTPALPTELYGAPWNYVFI